MESNKNNLPQIDFHISHFQVSVVIFVERAFEKLHIQDNDKFYSLNEFIEIINHQNLAPFWLNDNQIKDVIIKMVDLRMLEDSNNKYRFKPIDFKQKNWFLKN